ncbi:enolase [Culex quinquefasciatus]|uniref:Enolase n=1 Tax=Culex quinquefasciatus TaxID=7176 RepID=B0X5U4_CULQU|nr:enolase [Culex quinquefasciatus]|eukprot:XP_001865015.1 enolase [Culex quinquefasciatus]
MVIKALKKYAVLDRFTATQLEDLVIDEDEAMEGFKRNATYRTRLAYQMARISQKALENINNLISPAVMAFGLCVTQQKEIDELMLRLDGTKNKSKLGANAILGVSRVQGCHADNKLQEFMILPTGGSFFTEAMKICTEVYHPLKNVIKAKFGLDATTVGDEGGFAPNILEHKEALNLI